MNYFKYRSWLARPLQYIILTAEDGLKQGREISPNLVGSKH